MAPSAVPSGPPKGTSPGAPGSKGRVLVPVVALLLGGLLGAGAMKLVDGGTGGAPVAAPTSAPTTTAATPTAPPGGRVEVPAACLEIADEAQGLTGVLDRGVTAARDLDAASLSALVRQFADKQQTIEGLARTCRQRAGVPAVVTTTG